MKRGQTIIIALLISVVCSAQQNSAYQFAKNYLSAVEFMKIGLQFNGTEKMTFFCAKAKSSAEHAQKLLNSFPKTLLSKITTAENGKLKERLQTIIEKSASGYFEDELVLRISLHWTYYWKGRYLNYSGNY